MGLCTMKSKKDKTGIGIIGLGERGLGTLPLLLAMDDIEVAAVCDLYEDRVAKGVQLAIDAGKAAPACFSDYNQVISLDCVDCIIITTSWTSHPEILMAALNAGKPAATEVGGASSLNECWDLVRNCERTGTPCMMLENCCYGREEMALLQMVRQGVFGELIHCRCAYEHDLREQVARGVENRHYRFHNYQHRNGDVYPTHGLGPLAKLLDINRGNRFVSISSMATKSRGIHLWAREHLGSDHHSSVIDFAMGDVVTSMIKCARGETILLTHDTSLPRPYSRGGRVQGTKGIWIEDNASIYIEGKSPLDAWEPFSRYMEKYEHPLWQKSSIQEYCAGHGGMDYLVLRAFIENVRDKSILPIDVYDMASWMAVTPLSEQSIALGSMPVPFPDFTDGKWINRKEEAPSKYGLNKTL
jgi:predicted dehydrogenase